MGTGRAGITHVPASMAGHTMRSFSATGTVGGVGLEMIVIFRMAIIML